MKCPHCEKEIQNNNLVKFKSLGIEVDFKQQQNNKIFEDIKIPKSWRMLRLEELKEVMNYIVDNKLDIWSYFEQPIKNTKNVARFVADSNGAVLDCYGDSGGLYSSLGVIFCRDLKEKEDEI